MQKARDASKKLIESLDPKEIIRDRKLLIAESDPVHRAYLLKLSLELGFETRKIFMAKDGAETLHFVRHEGVTSILFSDSLEMRILDQIQETLIRVNPETVFIFLLTQNSSQAGIGRAVEAEVDGFCLRPFAGEEFKKEFLQALTTKLLPDEFRKVLNLGKARLFSGDLEQAEKLFEKAKTLDPSPSSAHFYAGQVKLMRSLLTDSQEEFKQGIHQNQIHCKCLKAMFEVLQSQGRTEESYEILRRLVGVFPENTDRLKLAIRMAVKTGNFFDILTWFEVYEGQPERPEEVKKTICSALSVLGRYLLMSAKPEEALAVFERVLSVGYQKATFLTYVVESLQKYGYSAEAVQFMKRHSSDAAVDAA